MLRMPLFPFLIGLYFPLFLLSKNIHRFSLIELWGPLALIIFCQIVAFICVRLISNDKYDAAGIVFIMTLILFSYTILIKPAEIISPQRLLPGFGPYALVFAFQILVFLLMMFLTIKKIIRWEKLNLSLNYFSLLLIFFVTIALGKFWVLNSNTNLNRESNNPSTQISSNVINTAMHPLPDIYHIVMDGYPRADMLASKYDYDNTPFLNKLKESGFEIRNNAFANYPITALSMSATLNSEYLDTFFPNRNINLEDWKPLHNLIYNSRTAKILKENGYKYYILRNGWELGKSDLVDVYLQPNWNFQSGYLTEYQNGLFAMTPLPILLRYLNSDIGSVDDQKRKRIYFTFSKTQELAKEKGLKYVYSHIIAPHPPTVFNATGEPVPENKHEELIIKDVEKLKRLVTEEIKFLNKQLLHMIKNIKNNSLNEVVFILQSDHGLPIIVPDKNKEFTPADIKDFYYQRFGILAAIHLPKKFQKDNLPMPRTSINFYPYIFQNIFNSKEKMLDDRIFYSTYEKIFNWKEITGILIQ